MPLKIQIASDIHSEFWSKKNPFNFIKPSAPILALLGDIGCVGSADDFEVYKRFVTEQLARFDHVILVAGNHEYYYNPPTTKSKPGKDNTLGACNKKIKEFAAMFPNLHFLNRSTMKLTVNKKKYVIVGTALWTWIPKDQRSQIQDRMNDYKYIYVQDPKTNNIRNINSDDVAAIHIKNSLYIKSQIIAAKKSDASVVVLTHHKPYLKKSHDPNSYACAYESDLTHLFTKNLVVWAYGHTHIKDICTIKGVKIVSNPKGYPRQQTRFDSSFTISV
jgi:predicted phosphodiesterase